MHWGGGKRRLAAPVKPGHVRTMSGIGASGCGESRALGGRALSQDTVMQKGWHSWFPCGTNVSVVEAWNRDQREP
jgi:hypothetical protein